MTDESDAEDPSGGSDGGGDPLHPPNRVDEVVRNCEVIAESLTMLADRQDRSYEEFAGDRALQDVVERRFEKATQAAIDVATIVLGDRGCEVPPANADRMRKLGVEGVLPAGDGPTDSLDSVDGLAEEMAEAAGFRNVLAHEYGDVLDEEVVYQALQDLERYYEFVEAIRSYLDGTGSLDG